VKKKGISGKREKLARKEKTQGTREEEENPKTEKLRNRRLRKNQRLETGKAPGRSKDSHRAWFVVKVN